MSEPHVVLALRERYARMAGELQACKVKERHLIVGMRHVAAVLRLYREDEDVEAIKPIKPMVRPRWATGAAWSQIALDVLRTANGPMTAGEVAAQVMTRCGLDPADRKALKSIQCSLYGVFTKREGDMLQRHGGHPKRWSVA